MEDLKIILPCGYSTEYKHLKTNSVTIECPICDTHYVDVEQCLNMPKNRFNIKKKLIDIEYNKLLKLKQEFEKNKQLIEFKIIQNFDKIKQEMSNRREKLNEDVELAIDNYYIELLKKVESEKLKVKNIVDVKSKEFNSTFEQLDLNILSEEISNSNFKKVSEFLDKVQSMKKNFESIISNVERGQEFRLIEPSESIDIEDLFGELRTKQNFNYSLDKTFDEHTSSVYDLALFGTDTILSASRDKTIISWDRNTGKLLKTFEGHTNTVFCLAVLSSNLFASGSADNTIRIWNIDLNESIKILEGHSDYVSDIIFLNKGKIASASYDLLIKIWDYETGSCLKSLLGHIEIINHLDLVNNDLLISGSSDKNIKIWNLTTGNQIKNIFSESIIYCLKVLNINLVAIGSSESIKICKLDTGELINTFYGHTCEVIDLKKFDKNYLISCSHDGTIRIWDFISGECKKIIETEFDKCIRLLVTNDGEIFCGSNKGLIKCWKLEKDL